MTNETAPLSEKHENEVAAESPVAKKVKVDEAASVASEAQNGEAEPVDEKAAENAEEAVENADDKSDGNADKTDDKTDDKASEKPDEKAAEPVEDAKAPADEPAEDTNGAAAEESKSKLEIGDELPDITLKDQDDNDVNLKSVAAKQTVILLAYPKASTPGCTKQVRGFRDHIEEYNAEGVAVFGISADSVKAQKTFHTKQELPYPLLSDPQFKLIGPLGARKAAKGVKRSHWVFKDGKLAVSKVQISPAESIAEGLTDVK